jgi:hypothetical protein
MRLHSLILNIGFAMKGLSEAVIALNRSDQAKDPDPERVRDFVFQVSTGLGACDRYLKDAFSALNEPQEFTKKEANFSSSLHTYLRKFEDTHLSCAIYRYVDEDRGDLAWKTFCQHIVKLDKKKVTERDVHDVLQFVHKAVDTSGEDDRIFYHLLQTWFEQKLDRQGKAKPESNLVAAINFCLDPST